MSVVSRWGPPALVALYVALALAVTSTWEWTHDEALTLDVAVAHAPTASDLQAPVPIGDLTADLASPGDDGPAELLAYIAEPGRMFHPPAYYLLLQAWARAFGTSRWSVHALNMVFGVLALFGLGRCARHLLPGARRHLAAVLLFAVSPWFLYQTNNARPYALAVCLAVWSTAAVLEIGERRRARAWRLAFVALSAAGLYTVYHYALVLVWQGVLLLLSAVRRARGPRRADLLALLAMVVAIGLAFAPWWPAFRSQLVQAGQSPYYYSGFLGWTAWPAGLASLARQFLLGAVGTSRGGPDLQPALAILGASTVVALALSVTRSSWAGLTPTARRAWLCAPLLPALIVGLDAWRGMHTLIIGHTSFALMPGLVLVIAGSWTGAPGRTARVAGLAAWVLLSLTATLADASLRGSTRNAMEVVADQIAARDDERQLVMVNSANRGSLTTLLLELRARHVERARLTLAEENPAMLVRGAGIRRAINRITLVDFDVTYGEAEPGWDDAAREAAASQARRLGWEVVALDPRAPSVPATPGARVVLIASPVPVRY